MIRRYSYHGEGGEILERGFAPLLLTLPLPPHRQIETSVVLGIEVE